MFDALGILRNYFSQTGYDEKITIFSAHTVDLLPILGPGCLA
jgi:hypothetical protein